MSQIQPDPSDPIPDPEQPGVPKHPAPPPRRARRRWVKVVLGILGLLILLLIFAPTIASTGPVRSFVVGKINDNLNGRVAIADWSLGWFSGIKVSGIQVYDERNVMILDAPRIKTDLTLLDAARGNFNIGETVIDVANFILRVDESGSTNFERLPQPAATKSPPSDGPAELPDVRGSITVNYQGSVESPGNPIVHVNPSTAVIGIPGINAPIRNELKLAFRVADGTPGLVTVSGRVAIAENNKLRIDKLSANQDVSLKDVDLAAASAFVPGMQFGGMGNGTLAINFGGVNGLGATGEIVVENFEAGGDALNGDTFRTARLTVPVQITRGSDGSEVVLKFEKLGVQMPEASVAVAGQVPERAILNLLEGKKPGAPGDIRIITNVDNIAAIANQIPKTLKLQQGVALSGGKFAQSSHIAIRPETVKISQTTDLSAEGTNNGRAVRLSPIHAQTELVVVPTGKPMPELRDLSLLLQSNFAQVKGGGKSLAELAITSEFDLEKLRAELGQFVELPEHLNGNGRLALNTRGDPTRDDQPIDADVKLSLFPAGETRQSLVDLDAAAKVMLASGTVPAFDLKTLTVKDLNQLQQQFGALVPALAEQKIRLDSGQLQATARGSYDGKEVKLTQPLALSMPNLTVSQDGKQILVNEKITATVAAGMSLQKDEMRITSAQVESPFATATIKDAIVLLSAPPIGMVQSADVQARVPDLPKLWKLANVVAPPAALAPGEHPLEITSGGASLALKIQKTSSGSTIDLTDCRVSKLTLKRGDRSYPFDREKPISLKLTAEITGKEAPESIKVTALNGDLRVTSLSMPQPITVSNLAGNPTASGALAASGAIQNVTPLLAVLNGTDEMPYDGDFALTQTVQTQGDAIVLIGDLTTRQFKVYDERRKTVLFAEDQVAIRNDISLDPARQVAEIKSLSMDMPQSKAVALNLTGGIRDWQKRGIYKDVKIDLTYDLAKVWPIVKPMLSPQTQERLKDLKIAGQYTKQFLVRGSYPAVDSSGKELPWFEAVRSLNASGDLSVQTLDTSGLKIENLEVPVYLDKGRLAIEYAGKPKGERLPKPASCNGGTLDMGGIVVDLGQGAPRLSVGKNQKLLRDVTINPLLGDSLGKFVNPIFPNSEQAKGLLDVTVSYCENLALGEAIQTAQSGRARVVFSIREMDIANPLGSLMLGPLVQVAGPLFKISSFSREQADAFRGVIRDAVVTLEAGRTTQDITLQLAAVQPEQLSAAKPSQPTLTPLRFQGDVSLKTLEQSLAVNVPLGLFPLSEKDLRKAARIFPEGFPIALRGTTLKPKVDIGDIGKQIIDAQIRGLLGGGEGSDNPLGGLLENLGKKKEKDRDK